MQIVRRVRCSDQSEAPGVAGRRRHLAVPVLAALALLGAQATQPLPPVGESLSREIAGGATHAYTVELAAGDFLRAVAVQQGIDLLVRLYAPDGTQVLEGDSPNGRNGPEPASYVAESTGRYRLEVVSPSERAAAGGYELRVEALRPATARDRSLAEAERTQHAGLMAGFGEGTAEGRERGRQLLGQALVLWRELGDERAEAEALDLLSTVARQDEQIDRAAAWSERSAELWHRLGEKPLEAQAFRNVGTALMQAGRTGPSEAAFRRALELYGELGDRPNEARQHASLGRLYHRRGDLIGARRELTTSLAALREVGEPADVALALNNLGLLESDLGEVDAAIGRYREGLEIARTRPVGEVETALVNNLGLALESQGRLQDALDHFRAAQQAAEHHGNRRGEGFAVHNLGDLYLLLGRPDEAIPFFERARTLLHEVGDRGAESFTLHNLAWCELRLGRPAAAAPLAEEALAGAREVGDRTLEARVLALASAVAAAQDRTGDAEARATEAVAVARAIDAEPLEALALIRRGKAVAEQGRLAEARADLGRSLALSVAGERPLGQAQAHVELAAVERTAGRLDAARTELEASLGLLEDLRTSVAVEELRTSFLADRGEVYQRYVDLLMTLAAAEPDAGWERRALAASERMRSRSLLDLLAEARVDLDRGIDPALIERERELGRWLNALERRRLVLVGGGEPQQAAALDDEIRDLDREDQWARAEIRRASPQRAALVQPATVDAGEIQRDLLTAGTTLLEYSLGDDRSFLWVVQPAALAAYELPGRGEIEPLARRLHEELAGGDADDPELGADARRLSDLLLGPAAGRLGDDRLVIVADGALHYVPFAVLPDPAPAADGAASAEAAPLLVRHEVVHLPSASTLALLTDAPDRPPPTRQVALFADPVFDADDPRVRPPETDGLPAATTREDAGDLDFRRLRFSRQEAERIARLVPADERLEAYDFAASRAAATSPELARYRYVHFATHAVVREEIPALSGLVLSQVDAAGRPVDGFLRLHDLYDLHLGADLVTLSACRTALGREFRGEGLVGLTRGFMYSGAERVAASLWEVDDRATAEIMGRFYRGMLEEELTPAAALRAAQLAMWRSERWRAPRYWAAFVLEGRWD